MIYISDLLFLVGIKEISVFWLICITVKNRQYIVSLDDILEQQQYCQSSN